MVRNLRNTELSLIAIAGAATVAGLALTSLAKIREVPEEALLPGIALLVALLIVHFGLVIGGFRGDQLLLGIAALLSGVGLAEVTRLAPSLSLRQTIWILVGLTTLVAVIVFPRPIHWLKKYRYTWAILGLLLLMLTVVIGKDPNQSGARLWIGVGDLLFQPSELLKVLLAIFLAAYLEDKRELLSAGVYRIGRLQLPPLPYLGPLVVMWGVSVLVLLGQRDLGPAFLLFGVFLAVLYVASSRLVYVWSGLAMFSFAFYVASRFVQHAATRLEIWMNPWADPQGSAYQLVQALVAIANGGILGTGLGFGRPNLIPAVYTDFPFAALSEELGMAGMLALLAVYMVLSFRGLRIALEAREAFTQLLAVALTAVIALQTLIIIGGNMRVVPLTGITLPFVSYGGSSLLANFLIIGLLLRISHENQRGAGSP